MRVFALLCLLGLAAAGRENLLLDVGKTETWTSGSCYVGDSSGAKHSDTGVMTDGNTVSGDGYWHSCNGEQGTATFGLPSLSSVSMVQLFSRKGYGERLEGITAYLVEQDGTSHKCGGTFRAGTVSTVGCDSRIKARYVTVKAGRHTINVAEVKVLGTKIIDAEDANLLIDVGGSNTWTSGDCYVGDSSGAKHSDTGVMTDGNTVSGNGYWHSCRSGKQGGFAMFGLPSISHVESVSLWSRQGFSSRMNGVRVHVVAKDGTEHSCGIVRPTHRFPLSGVKCPADVDSRYIKVYAANGATLNIAEVQAFGKSSAGMLGDNLILDVGGDNAWSSGSCYVGHSSGVKDFNSGVLTDGNTKSKDGYWHSCGNKGDATFRLPAEHCEGCYSSISMVELFNRNDCCSDRINGLSAWLLDIDGKWSKCSKNFVDHGAGTPSAVGCDASIKAVAVKIVGGAINIAEARAYGKKFEPECWITVDKCPNHPYVKGTFRDNWGEARGAKESADKCFKRAEDHYTWCGLQDKKSEKGKTLTVSAEYKGPAGDASETYTYADHYTGCFVTLPSCPSHPNTCSKYPCTYKDKWAHENRGALQDPTQCARRASDHFYWCGLAGLAHSYQQFKGEVTATHFENGEVTKSKAFVGRCVHSVTGCPKQPQFNQGGKWPYTWIDTWGEDNANAGDNAASCYTRGRQTKAWCGLGANQTKSWYRATPGKPGFASLANQEWPTTPGPIRDFKKKNFAGAFVSTDGCPVTCGFDVRHETVAVYYPAGAVWVDGQGMVMGKDITHRCWHDAPSVKEAKKGTHQCHCICEDPRPGLDWPYKRPGSGDQPKRRYNHEKQGTTPGRANFPNKKNQ
jgi:hypothetical protein